MSFPSPPPYGHNESPSKYIFKLVRSANPEQLELDVEIMLNQGWKFHGFTISHGHMLIQPMYKETYAYNPNSFLTETSSYTTETSAGGPT